VRCFSLFFATTTNHTFPTFKALWHPVAVADMSKESALYQRLYIAREDLHFANSFAQHLLKKGWHFAPWERRWTTYVQQAAFTSAFVTAYARPFTRSVGWPEFPMRLAPYLQTELRLHQQIILLRHQVYAHSDSSRHNVRPMRIVGHPSAIVGSPFLRLSKDELELAIVMIRKTISLLEQELEMLMPRIEREPSPSRTPAAQTSPVSGPPGTTVLNERHDRSAKPRKLKTRP
jgi:hypothetical protein